MTQKSEQTKKRILKVALKLFQERGFEETTMRNIADGAGVATGASYYHFKNKADIVRHFYEILADEFSDATDKIAAKTDDFGERLRLAMEFRYESLLPYRDSLPAMVRLAIDPGSPLSAFSSGTAKLRDQAIGDFQRLMQGTDLKLPASVSARMPLMLWLWHLLCLYYWLLDGTKKQANTKRLLEQSIQMTPTFLHLLSFPGMTEQLNPFLELLDALNLNTNQEATHES